MENGKMDKDNVLQEPILTLSLQQVKMVLNQLPKFILEHGTKTKNQVLVNKIILVLDTIMDTGKMVKKMEKV